MLCHAGRSPVAVFDADEYKYRAVGECRDLLTGDAINAIYDVTDGNPRLVGKGLQNIYIETALQWAEVRCSPIEDWEISQEHAERVFSQTRVETREPDKTVSPE